MSGNKIALIMKVSMAEVEREIPPGAVYYAEPDTAAELIATGQAVLRDEVELRNAMDTLKRYGAGVAVYGGGPSVELRAAAQQAGVAISHVDKPRRGPGRPRKEAAAPAEVEGVAQNVDGNEQN